MESGFVGEWPMAVCGRQLMPLIAACSFQCRMAPPVRTRAKAALVRTADNQRNEGGSPPPPREGERKREKEGRW